MVFWVAADILSIVNGLYCGWWQLAVGVCGRWWFFFSCDRKRSSCKSSPGIHREQKRDYMTNMSKNLTSFFFLSSLKALRWLHDSSKPVHKAVCGKETSPTLADVHVLVSASPNWSALAMRRVTFVCPTQPPIAIWRENNDEFTATIRTSIAIDVVGLLTVWLKTGRWMTVVNSLRLQMSGKYYL